MVFILLDLQKMMDSIASKQVDGTTVTVEMVKATKPGIRVSNIEADKCDEECLQPYFGNAKLSGGGKVESIEIISGTEAIIIFSDPAGIQIVYALLLFRLHLFVTYPCSYVL